jgi:hypothetical protein
MAPAHLHHAAICARQNRLIPQPPAVGIIAP